MPSCASWQFWASEIDVALHDLDVFANFVSPSRNPRTHSTNGRVPQMTAPFLGVRQDTGGVLWLALRKVSTLPHAADVIW